MFASGMTPDLFVCLFVCCISGAITLTSFPTAFGIPTHSNMFASDNMGGGFQFE